MQCNGAFTWKLARTGWLLVAGLVVGIALSPVARAGPEDGAPEEIAPAVEAGAPDEAAPAPEEAVVSDVAPPAPAAPCAPCACETYPCCACKQPQAAPCPPKYDNLRFREDWSPCLCRPCDPCAHWSDRIKAVRLVRNGGIWANFGGQVRFRYEAFDDLGFGAAADPDQSWLLARVRAHADLHVGRNLRLFVEGIYADQFDERNPTPRPIDVNEGDVLNLFGEARVQCAGGLEVGAWAGRRELQLGKQRLVSPLDWANTRRTFQGAGGWAQRGFHRVEGFFVRPVVIDGGVLDDDWNEDRWFWGLDYVNDALNCVTWGAYVFGLHESRTAAQVPQDRYTVGVRADGRIPATRFDYDLEGAWQFGESGGADIAAGMFSATFGWRPCTRCFDPRVAIGFDYASGDDDPLDPDVGTFHQLFPLAHKYLGHLDLIGRQNVIAARLEGSLKPLEKLTVRAWYHVFWRADEADAVYNAAGGVLRAVPAGGLPDRLIGSELDVMLEYRIDRHWTAMAEWAHFFTGDFIEKSGAGRDVDFWWFGIQGTF